MHELYNFHFLDTVSEQLHRQLAAMQGSALTPASLAILAKFQQDSKATQGVYLLMHKGLPVYVGKAAQMKSRLGKHLKKISGRKNINIADMTYKALLLDKSMSTAANEDILIGLFQRSTPALWNKSGFGPNDPGKERDTTEPGAFDTQFPIQDSFPIVSLTAPVTVGGLLMSMKEQLPYVFRYQKLSSYEAATVVNLAGISSDARTLFQAAVTALGVGWKGAIISYGMVLYRNNKHYPFGAEVVP